MIVRRVIFAVLALLLNSASALEVNGNIVTIHNTSDFIELSNNVNEKQLLYSGSTVLLAEDIDFEGYSDKFNPVGKSFQEEVGSCFSGSFDGQGHTISNLALNSSYRYVGLFGVMCGSSVKNVVLDSSCSVVSTHNFTHNSAYTAGLFGYIHPSDIT